MIEVKFTIKENEEGKVQLHRDVTTDDQVTREQSLIAHNVVEAVQDRIISKFSTKEQPDAIREEKGRAEG